MISLDVGRESAVDDALLGRSGFDASNRKRMSMADDKTLRSYRSNDTYRRGANADAHGVRGHLRNWDIEQFEPFPAAELVDPDGAHAGRLNERGARAGSPL